jgi:hypothetical protein
VSFKCAFQNAFFKEVASRAGGRRRGVKNVCAKKHKKNMIRNYLLFCTFRFNRKTGLSHNVKDKRDEVHTQRLFFLTTEEAQRREFRSIESSSKGGRKKICLEGLWGRA